MKIDPQDERQRYRSFSVDISDLQIAHFLRGHVISETTEDRHIVTMDDYQNVVCALSNDAIADDIAWP